jgi:hypothetical protein
MRQNQAPHGWPILRLQRRHNPRRYEGWSKQTLEHRVESADQSETSRLSRARAWFGAEPRPLALVRPLRSTVRVLHLIAVGALYGGHVYDVSAERLIPALVATLATGGAFVALESYPGRQRRAALGSEGAHPDPGGGDWSRRVAHARGLALPLAPARTRRRNPGERMSLPRFSVRRARCGSMSATDGITRADASTNA